MPDLYAEKAKERNALEAAAKEAKEDKKAKKKAEKRKEAPKEEGNVTDLPTPTPFGVDLPLSAKSTPSTPSSFGHNLPLLDIYPQ